jgi:hypothetical protein
MPILMKQESTCQKQKKSQGLYGNAANNEINEEKQYAKLKSPQQPYKTQEGEMNRQRNGEESRYYNYILTRFY